MGGDNERFPATSWTHIRGIHAQGQAQPRLLLDHLVGRYWKPVYCYLLRKGCDRESAKDLTQGFFAEVVLGRRLVERADQAKGRFRTFLLTALDRYVVDDHRRRGAGKGASSQAMPTVPLEELPDLAAEALAGQPEEVFNYVWATTLLDEVLARVETDCHRHGQDLHWEVFKARVLAPILSNRPPEPLSSICRRLGIARGSSASNMIVTVERRFRSALLETLSQQVRCPAEAEEELHALMNALGRSGAR